LTKQLITKFNYLKVNDLILIRSGKFIPNSKILITLE